MVLVSCWKVKIYAHEKSLALKSGSGPGKLGKLIYRMIFMTQSALKTHKELKIMLRKDYTERCEYYKLRNEILPRKFSSFRLFYGVSKCSIIWKIDEVFHKLYLNFPQNNIFFQF